MARKRKKKGHARGLRRRYGRSLGAQQVRMNVKGQLVLDPETLEQVIENAVENATVEAIPEVVAEAAEEAVERFEESSGYPSGYPEHFDYYN
jgi:hypothetical protein